MGKIVCQCKKEFDTKIEYEMHLSHNRNHRPTSTTSTSTQKETPYATKVEEVEKIEEEPEINEDPPYSLAASREGLGELSPVLLASNGEVIDGFHRLGENADWHSITVPSIDTPVKLELARLAVNFNRRKVSPQELTQRITFLIKNGLKPDEIASQTGINLRTVYKHMPQEFKNPKMIEAGQSRQKANSTDAPGHLTVNIPDKKEINLNPSLGTASTYTPKTTAATEEPQPIEPEEIPENCPICPICHSSLDPAEYKQVKQAVATEYGKQIQTLLFPQGQAKKE